MPQIAQIGEIYASQLFWLTIFFGLSLIVIGYGMLPKIQSTIGARDDQISADLKQAQAAQDSADKLEEDYRASLEEARSSANNRAAEAKAEAARQTEAKIKRAEENIDKKLGSASAELAAQRSAAMAEIEAVAAEATQAMVAKVAGLQVSEAAARQAVAKEMA